MATIITSDCINCGACEAECPNTAIYQGGVEWELNGVKHPALSADVFYIVGDKCTECVGFFDHEACAAVCPVDCCIPDPDRPETEDVLLARVKQLHADKSFGDTFPSRFRTGAATTAKEAAPAQAEPAPPVVAAPAPTATPAPPAAPPPVQSPSPAQVTAPAPAAETGTPTPPKAQAPAKAPASTAAAPATPAAKASAEPATQPPPEPSTGIPGPETWEIPIECFRCGHNYAIPFKHFRSGAVLYCPACHGSLVVTTSLYGAVNRAVRGFYPGWREQCLRNQTERPTVGGHISAGQQAQLTAFLASVQETTRSIRVPGAPRKRAGMFG